MRSPPIPLSLVRSVPGLHERTAMQDLCTHYFLYLGFSFSGHSSGWFFYIFQDLLETCLTFPGHTKISPVLPTFLFYLSHIFGSFIPFFYLLFLIIKYFLEFYLISLLAFQLYLLSLVIALGITICIINLL